MYKAVSKTQRKIEKETLVLIQIAKQLRDAGDIDAAIQIEKSAHKVEQHIFELKNVVRDEISEIHHLTKKAAEGIPTDG